ncbi:MAG: GNAT family N-acetyltransferase [Firmicutes bacterium]|nr:GNAT family N-acetyltransferase [Bacillota bacterium]NBI61960.1 GNAT family N-acetyltransferase [Clostridiales bacterium]
MAISEGSQKTIKLEPAASAALVETIVKETIKAIYPHYYPAGAVEFFLDLHAEKQIKEALLKEEIYLAVAQGVTVATGSVRRNEICRLFVLPEHQNKGYGSQLMDLLEEKIFENHETVHVDASFPAEAMYLKRGYSFVSYERIETENGDFLCYHIMEKRATAKTRREQESQ